MRIDFDQVRSLIERVERDSPFEIHPLLPVFDFKGDKPGEEFSIRMQIPTNEGDEFSHWRWMCEAKLIRVTHEGRPGLGRSKSRVDGLLPKGHDFFELSRDESAWERAKARCQAAEANTLGSLIAELRREARIRIKSANEKE